MKKLKFIAQCFFCEKGIVEKGQDPVSLIAIGAKKIDMEKGRFIEPSQTFWCHCKCLAARVGDPYSLNPDLGGKEIDFKKMNIVEMAPWLKRK